MNEYVAVSIGIMVGVTALLRALPFLVFSSGRKTPAVISYLGKVLPYAIIGMLVVYCLKGTNLLVGSHGIPEAIAVLCVVLLHLWRRNTILSVAGGTVIYMLLVQLVF